MLDISFRGRIPKWPISDQQDEEAIVEVLRSRNWWRGNGSIGSAFEKAFAEFTGASHTRVVANGTMALELALQALNIGPGDEVLVPACTFVSTATAVLRLGAWPVPVDVERTTLNMDPANLEAAISPRTRCIIPVHMAGQIARMPEIMAFARRHSLSVIEDAAHAHGAVAYDQPAGAWGDMTIYSFQAGKLMTCGEGGAVTTNRSDLAEKTFALHSCGRPQGDTEYRHLMPTTNMRLSEMLSAVLLGQLQRLPDQLKKREEMAPILDTELAASGAVPLSRSENADVHSHYMAMAWLPREAYDHIEISALTRTLREAGLPAFRCFPEFHKTEMFSPQQIAKLAGRNAEPPNYSAIETPVAAAAARDVVWLHHSVLLGDEKLLKDIGRAVRCLLVDAAKAA